MSNIIGNPISRLMMDRTYGAWVVITDGDELCGVDPTASQICDAYFDGESPPHVSMASAIGLSLVEGRTRNVHDALAAEGLAEIRDEIAAASESGNVYAQLGDLSLYVSLEATNTLAHINGMETRIE